MAHFLLFDTLKTAGFLVSRNFNAIWLKNYLFKSLESLIITHQQSYVCSCLMGEHLPKRLNLKGQSVD